MLVDWGFAGSMSRAFSPGNLDNVSKIGDQFHRC